MKKADRRVSKGSAGVRMLIAMQVCETRDNGSLVLGPPRTPLTRQPRRQPLMWRSLFTSYTKLAMAAADLHSSTTRSCLLRRLRTYDAGATPIPVVPVLALDQPTHHAVPRSVELRQICCYSAALRVARRRALLAGVRIVVARLHRCTEPSSVLVRMLMI